MPDKAIESRSAAGESSDLNRELDFLYRLGETIGATLDADLIPGMALQVSLEITDADVGAVILLEDDGWRVVGGAESAATVLVRKSARVFGPTRATGRPRGKNARPRCL